MPSPSWRVLGLRLLTLCLAYLAWIYFVPPLPLFEAVRWDESDRARDAIYLLRDLKQLKLWEPLRVLYESSTWGAFFPFLGVPALALLGLEMHSLSFVSFLALGSLVMGAFVWTKAKEWPLALCWALATLFLVGAFKSYLPFWTILMLEGWGTVAWSFLFLAFYRRDTKLLMATSWFMMFLRPTYYIFFLAAVGLHFVSDNAGPWLLDVWRRATTGSRVLLGLILFLAVHVVFCKLGLVELYGKASWAGHRSLRTPVHVIVILFAAYVWRERTWLVPRFTHDPLLQRWLKYFFFPATLWMAVPWPNRWAPIVLIQSFGSNVQGLKNRLLYYPELWRESLDSQVGLMLGVGLVSLLGVVAIFRSPRPYRKLASLLLVVHLVLLCVSSNNYELRFAMSLFFALPLMGIVWLWNALPKPSLRGGFVVLLVGLNILLFRNLDRSLFVEGLPRWTLNYSEFPKLFPLRNSLAAAHKQHSTPTSEFLVLLDEPQGTWDKTLQSFNELQKLRTDPIRATPVFPKDLACKTSAETRETVLRTTALGWEKISCVD